MAPEHPGFPLTRPFQALAPDDPREVGGFRLVARLGAGGMGRVYLSHTPAGRPVALKMVRPELAADHDFRRRFAQEVASARRIHGLYTAQVVGSGTEEAGPWLATAYVPGPSLQQVIDEHGILPLRTALLLTAGVAEALQVIHGAGVVHRDLKPANVLVAADGPRVIDFGIARPANATALTSAGLVIGSPAFMAPEQALGRAVTPATDVFALGALAVYAIGGTPPFGDDPGPTALYRTVHEEPDLSGVPGELRPLLHRCLAKDPTHRPTPAQLIEAVRDHPSIGGRLRFTDDWLPHRIGTEILRRADLPSAPPHSPTETSPAAPPTPSPTRPATLASTAGPTPSAAATPITARGSEPSSRRRAAPRSHRSGRTVLAVAAALVLGACGAVYLLDDPYENEPYENEPTVGAGDAPPPSTPPKATPPRTTPSKAAPSKATPGYVPAYTGTELTSPDQGYEFDIRAGKVAPQDTAAWYVGRTASEFYVPEDSEAYIAEGGRPDLAACVRGIESRPVTALPFSALGAGRSFCVRAQDGRDIAVVNVLATSTDGGPVTVSLDHYRRSD
ncbi:serine/threonine-protein kinase [Streptomyces sp. NPDC093093]|uniref:serine/threonine-protein kinase n=1 Tax=Streptomyces sp. NPDC093093 TaxID=3366025 RepID=UPI00382E3EEC